MYIHTQDYIINTDIYRTPRAPRHFKFLCLTRYIIKYLGVKCHYVCDLFSNDSVVKLYI